MTEVFNAATPDDIQRQRKARPRLSPGANRSLVAVLLGSLALGGCGSSLQMGQTGAGVEMEGLLACISGSTPSP